MVKYVEKQSMIYIKVITSWHIRSLVVFMWMLKCSLKNVVNSQVGLDVLPFELRKKGSSSGNYFKVRRDYS
jgi:hypothetical protein